MKTLIYAATYAIDNKKRTSMPMVLNVPEFEHISELIGLASAIFNGRHKSQYRLKEVPKNTPGYDSLVEYNDTINTPEEFIHWCRTVKVCAEFPVVKFVPQHILRTAISLAIPGVKFKIGKKNFDTYFRYTVYFSTSGMSECLTLNEQVTAEKIRRILLENNLVCNGSLHSDEYGHKYFCSNKDLTFTPAFGEHGYSDKFIVHEDCLVKEVVDTKIVEL